MHGAEKARRPQFDASLNSLNPDAGGPKVAIPVSGAEDACLQLGGFLASIHSDAEQVGLTML